MARQLLDLKILSPRDLIFQGKVWAVSSENTQGKFDILPYHANFITMVENKPIIIRDDKNNQTKYQFPLAIIYAADNKVSIYTDIQSQIA